MAAAWEFTLISKEAIPFEILQKIEKDYRDINKILAITCIDDWKWTNQQTLRNILEIEEKLTDGKIIIVEMQTSLWKSSGLCIERKEACLYTFWLNTEGIPELDTDQITAENKKYYDCAYRVLDTLIQKYNIPVGIESDIQYEADRKKMISSSSNVIAWLIRNDRERALPAEGEEYAFLTQIRVEGCISQSDKV